MLLLRHHNEIVKTTYKKNNYEDILIDRNKIVNWHVLSPTYRVVCK